MGDWCTMQSEYNKWNKFENLAGKPRNLIFEAINSNLIILLGIWQTLGQTISNGFTVRIPPIPLISNLWKSNSRNNATKLQYTVSNSDVIGESSSSTSTSIILEAEDNNNTKTEATNTDLSSSSSNSSPHKIVSAQNPGKRILWFCFSLPLFFVFTFTPSP